MKKIKRIISFFLCLLVVVTFSACGKKDEPEMKNPNENNPNELTLSEVLNTVYTDFDKLTKTEHGENPSFSSKSGSRYTYPLYDKFVYAGIYMLKLISETDGIKTDVWLQGDESELQIIDGEPSKLDALYITREKQEYLNLIKIYMVFHKKSLNFAENPQAFLIYDYSIGYDEKSHNLNITCNIENSSKREFQESGSTAIYSYFSYDSRFGFLQAANFERIKEIDYNNFNLSYFGTREVLIFDFNQNDLMMDETNTSIELQEHIKTLLLNNFAQSEPNKFYSMAEKENLKKESVDGLTDKFISVANASQISDFIK